MEEGKTSLWIYFPHTAALCTLIALAVCNGPLLYDFVVIYKGSLDGTVLIFVITTILHLFLWIVTWLFLTVKMTWKFKLRVTVGRATVNNARSIKLVNDIDLHHTPVDRENAPMLIVGFGKTFTIHDQVNNMNKILILFDLQSGTKKAYHADFGQSSNGNRQSIRG